MGYCRTRDIGFEVISNESVYDQEIKAENWLKIMRFLSNKEDCITENEESEIFKNIVVKGGLRLDEIIDMRDLQSTLFNEVALYRLLHQGKITCSLSSHKLSSESVFSPCE